MCYVELLKELDPKIKAIAKKVSRKYSYLDADDFYQEAVIYLWKICSSDEAEYMTHSYILQGCYYFLKNYMRKIIKKINNNTISIYSKINEESETLADKLTVPVYTVEAESVEIFLLCESVDSIFTEREKDIFYYKLEGYTTREIGSKIGISHVMVSKIEKNMRDKCSFVKKEIFC